MRTIEIPDDVYAEATRVATAHGQGFEQFALEALTNRLDDGPIRLTPEQLEKVDRAEADIDAGRFYSAEQLNERFAVERAGWIRENGR